MACRKHKFKIRMVGAHVYGFDCSECGRVVAIRKTILQNALLGRYPISWPALEVL